MAKSEGFGRGWKPHDGPQRRMFEDMYEDMMFGHFFFNARPNGATTIRRARIVVEAMQSDRFKYELLVRAMMTRLECERDKVVAWIDMAAGGRIL